jgi:hypothetical protein
MPENVSRIAGISPETVRPPAGGVVVSQTVVIQGAPTANLPHPRLKPSSLADVDRVIFLLADTAMIVDR